MPVHQHADEWRLVAGAVSSTTGATTRWRSSCRTHASPPIQVAARRRRRVQDDGAGAARRRARSDSRRGLQPHRRRRHLGPTLVVARHRQLQLLPARSRPAVAIRELHGHGQHARHALAARRSSSSWTACGTGSRRCTWTASGSISRPRLRAKPDEVDPLSGFCRRRPAGSGALAREAHRRALGRRSSTATRSEAFPPGWSSGTIATATHVRRFWRGDRGASADLPTRLAGSSDLYRDRSRVASRTASINFVTAHDGFTLADLVAYNEQAQRGERRKQPGRRAPQPELELRRRGPTTTPAVLELRRRQPPQLPADADGVARRADDLRRRRDWAGRSAATTTPTVTTRS